jgi:hypothetical protein
MTMRPQIYLLATLLLGLVTAFAGPEAAMALNCRQKSDGCFKNCTTKFESGAYTVEGHAACFRSCLLFFDECTEKELGDIYGGSKLDPGSPPPKGRPPVAKPGGGTKIGD